MNKQIKERGIIFNGEMVRAILDGRKTQTRRILSPRQLKMIDDASSIGECYELDSGLQHESSQSYYRELCPFGKVGDRLWVREAFQGPLIPEDEVCDFHGENPDKFYTPKYCEFAADGGPRPEYVDADDNNRHGWRPSIHMPRWASRITLEITDIRVQRLQAISVADAIAEGGTEYFNLDWFSGSWASIYGVESWQSNPFVWVVEFKRVEEA